eukprot:2707303-Alexandrium_andersonii.AAC.2
MGFIASAGLRANSQQHPPSFETFLWLRPSGGLRAPGPPRGAPPARPPVRFVVTNGLSARNETDPPDETFWGEIEAVLGAAQFQLASRAAIAIASLSAEALPEERLQCMSGAAYAVIVGR